MGPNLLVLVRNNTRHVPKILRVSLRPLKRSQALGAGVLLETGSSCLFSGKPSGIHAITKSVLARGGGGGKQQRMLYH